MAVFELALPVILEHEGGFTNGLHDPGGATKYGISLRFLKSMGIDIDRDGDVDVQDVGAMSIEVASSFYWQFWWYPGGFGRLAWQQVATKAFDMAVNMGPKQTHILIHRALRTPDGQVIDLRVLPVDAMNRASPDQLVADLCGVQTDFYVALAQTKPDLARFLPGWALRARWPFQAAPPRTREVA